MRLAAISIDLDEISHYCAIHGLPAPPPEAQWAMYERALPRFLELLDRRGIVATLFVVGQDLATQVARNAVTQWHSLGHEIANHSQNHRYDLSRLSETEVEYQVSACSAAIEDATGQKPSGFRAPGYTINERVLNALQSADILYDSSVFPCPAYYCAKTLALAAMRLKGRASRSILDTPRVLSAPADPYRHGTRFHRRGQGLLELPIGVTRTATGRLPFIGTSLTMAGPRGAKLLSRAMIGRPLVNLEMHGIDLADSTLDGLDFLKPYQPDLNFTWDAKLKSLETAINTLIAHRYRFVTLTEATSHFGRLPSQ